MIGPMHNQEWATQTRVIRPACGVVMKTLSGRLRVHRQPTKIRMSQLPLFVRHLHERLKRRFLQNETVFPRRHFFAARRAATSSSTFSWETLRPASIPACARASSSANPGVSFQRKILKCPATCARSTADIWSREALSSCTLMAKKWLRRRSTASSHFPCRLDPRDECRRAEPREKRHELNLRPHALQRPALARVELLQRVVARLRVDIRPQRPNLRVEPRCPKNKNRIHTRERAQRIRPLLLTLHRPTRPLQRPHTRIGVQRDKQRVAQRPRLLQIEQVPRVQQIEDAIRQHHTFARRAQPLASRHRSFERKEFWVVQIHVCASLTIPLRL